LFLDLRLRAAPWCCFPSWQVLFEILTFKISLTLPPWSAPTCRMLASLADIILVRIRVSQGGLSCAVVPDEPQQFSFLNSSP
jgi:hypothetical protein